MNDIEILEEIKKIYMINEKVSPVLLQRKLKISFEKAEKYIREFEKND